MRNIFVLFLLIILIASCTKETGSFDLSFKAIMKDEPLILNKAYEFGNMDIKFENLAFYVSDISLTDKKGGKVELADIEFISLNNFDELSASAGKSIRFNDIPTGTYKKINFTMGVASDLNSKTPSDFDVSDPLGRTDFYWADWKSYIFSKTEGSADTLRNGNFNLKFFYHTGSDELIRSYELVEDLNVDENFNFGLEIFFDYDKLLRKGDETYFDIKAFPRNHNPSELNVITQLVNNYIKAIKFRL